MVFTGEHIRSGSDRGPGLCSCSCWPGQSVSNMFSQYKISSWGDKPLSKASLVPLAHHHVLHLRSTSQEWTKSGHMLWD